MNKKYVNNQGQDGEPAYSLTKEDVASYLATKQDDEPVGISCHGTECLVAMAFKHKYPRLTDITVEHNCIYAGATTLIHPLDDEVRQLMEAFDDINTSFWGSPVTKREWLERTGQR